MYLFCCEAFEVGNIFRVISKLQLQTAHNVIIFCLDDLSKLTFRCSATSIVDTVVIHMVYEEQRKALDATFEKLTLLFYMRKNCFAYLSTTHQGSVHSTHHVVLSQLLSI